MLNLDCGLFQFHFPMLGGCESVRCTGPICVCFKTLYRSICIFFCFIHSYLAMRTSEFRNVFILVFVLFMNTCGGLYVFVTVETWHLDNPFRFTTVLLNLQHMARVPKLSLDSSDIQGLCIHLLWDWLDVNNTMGFICG